MPDPTFYNVMPVVVTQRMVADLQAATDPLEANQVAWPINSIALDAWIEIETGAGSAGNFDLFHEHGVVEVVIRGTVNANSPALTIGIAAGGHDPATADATLKTRKSGTGTALVYSYCVFALRPNMTP
jgi:hypothetical protein